MRAALLLSAWMMTVSGHAPAQIATFSEGAPTHLDPIARQSTGNRILEQLLGNDAMEPVAELAPSDIMRKLAAPVGRLTVTFKAGTTAPGEQGAYCTASLIDKDLILTNHHCVPGRGNVEQAWLTLGYLKPRSRTGVAQFPVKLPAVEASDALDYAILRVEGNPGAEWGTVALSAATPDALNSLFLIHHPGGYPQYVTRGRCQTSEPAVDGSDLLHTCDTIGGSSGAPIFDNNSRLVVGLHYSGVALKKLNAGKRIASIADASPIVAGILKRSAAAAAPAPSREADEVNAMRERLAALEAQMKQAPAAGAGPDVAALQTPPKPAAPAPARCTGVEADIAGSGKLCLATKDTFQDCFTVKGNRVCGPQMVAISPGRFLMGSTDAEIERFNKDYPQRKEGWFKSEAPKHEVEIPRAFAVGVTHVTRGEFAAFVAAAQHKADDDCWSYDGKMWNDNQASWRAPGFEQDDSHPLVCVNWYDAQAYVAWLKQQTGAEYRLLTEAEAEYVARGTSTAARQPRFFFGDDPNDLCKYGNGPDLTGKAKFPDWDVAQCKDGYVYTAPAGHFAANAFGVKDVHGNAWSWTQDCWTDNFSDAPKDGSNAVESKDCQDRVLRGGSWGSFVGDLRAAYRFSNPPGYRNSNYGFRVARSFSR